MKRSFVLALAAFLALCFATQSALAIDIERFFASPCEVYPKGDPLKLERGSERALFPRLGG